MVDAGGVVIWLGSAREDLVRGTVRRLQTIYLLFFNFKYENDSGRNIRICTFREIYTILSPRNINLSGLNSIWTTNIYYILILLEIGELVTSAS